MRQLYSSVVVFLLQVKRKLIWKTELSINLIDFENE